MATFVAAISMMQLLNPPLKIPTFKPELIHHEKSKNPTDVDRAATRHGGFPLPGPCANPGTLAFRRARDGSNQPVIIEATMRGDIAWRISFNASKGHAA